jgi:hypothetical protein
MDTDLDRLLSPDGFPPTAIRWESPGVKAVRHAWWASLPTEVAAPLQPVTSVTPAAAPTAVKSAAFTAASLSKDWWNREPAGSSAPGRSGLPLDQKPRAQPSAPARLSGQRALTYAAIAAFIVLLIIVIAIAAGA